MNTQALALRSHLQREARTEGVFRVATKFSAILVLALLAGVILSLIYGSWPALATFRWSFVTGERWNPVTEIFGALTPIYGTIATSIIALLFAVPLSFGIAVFLTETCPRWLRGPISMAIELLASVPSIVYGIWGLFVLAPILQHTVQPWLIEHLGPLPVVGVLFQGRLWHRAADGGHRAGDHGAAIHYLSDARSVSHGAAVAERGRLRTRCDAVECRVGCRHALVPRRRDRRIMLGLGARWEKRWP